MSVNIKDNIMTPDLLRTYEISLWTLQDSFIAVLGDSSSQTKGYIENPVMQLSNDGTQELDFSLPMYIDDGITRRKSNIWSLMTNAVTIAGMRKIKVVFNKGTEDEKVYEFIITTVTDTHELNRPMCEIHCEGLAFHELGKIGYKISLSLDDFYADEEEEWNRIADEQSHRQEENSTSDENEDDLDENNSSNEDSIEDETEESTTIQDSLAMIDIYELIETTIQPTINYWSEKIGLTLYPEDPNEIINSSIWYYRVNMDWSAYEHGYARDKHKVYEESYAASYEIDDEKDEITPQTYEQFKEKNRYVTASASNIYNLTLEIAKTFGVYCRYDYIHDENYHIIGRIVTYYNNFIDEKNRLEFTYPYTSKRITRENDCTDLVTKMYVNTIESDLSESGLITIMDNPVNPTGEDYLLNFDYLYAIDTITDELYGAIKKFSAEVKKINDAILYALDILIKQETVEVTYSALLEVLENTIAEDAKLLETYLAYLDDLTNGTRKLSRSGATRATLFVVNGKVTFTDLGIISNAKFKLYDDEEHILTFNAHTNNGFIDYAMVETNKTTVLAAYDYYPGLYYEEVIDLYAKRQARDQLLYNLLSEKIDRLHEEIDAAGNQLSNLLEEKNKLIKDFESLMGPALREGNWTPEDYSNVASAKYLILSNIITKNSIDSWPTNATSKIIKSSNNGPSAKLIWDTNLDYNEQDNKYLNMNGGQSYSYYYILPLVVDSDTERLTELVNFYANSENEGIPFGVLWYDSAYASHNRPSPIVKFFSIGSSCQCIFLSRIVNEVDELSGETMQYNRIIPALVLLDLDDNMCIDINKNSTLYLCGLTTKLENNIVTYVRKSSVSGKSPLALLSNDIISSSNYKTNLLRFRVNDYSLLTDELNLKIQYGDKLLTEFEDYSILLIVNPSDVETEKGYDITIKSDFLIKYWKAGNKLLINYNCSLLSTAIYLDAVLILKENAYPKVTYSIDPNLMYKNFFYTDYNALNKIAFINDHELEFNLVQGYITSITINLDKAWEDTIEVKNYKNKFEDIFSTIVALTESMEKSEAVITSVGNAVNIDGSLSSANLLSTISKITIKYALSNGTISLNKLDGLLGQSTNGVISVKPDGIFYGPTVNSWDTAINVNGINAAAIRWGTLSINNFKLSGDNLDLTSTSGIISNYKTIVDNESVIDGAISINGGSLISNKYSYTTTTILNETTLEEETIVSRNTDYSLSIINGTITINSASNLIIGNLSLESYVLGLVTNENVWESHGRYIPIRNVSIGQSNPNRGVYIQDSLFRLGVVANTGHGLPVFWYDKDTSIANADEQHIIRRLALKNGLFYYDNNITYFRLGNVLTYQTVNNAYQCNVAGWVLSLNNGLISTSGDTTVSLVSPTKLIYKVYTNEETYNLLNIDLTWDTPRVIVTKFCIDRTPSESNYNIYFRNTTGNKDHRLLLRPDNGLYTAYTSTTGDAVWHRVWTDADRDAMIQWLQGQ